MFNVTFAYLNIMYEWEQFASPVKPFRHSPFSIQFQVVYYSLTQTSTDGGLLFFRIRFSIRWTIQPLFSCFKIQIFYFIHYSDLVCQNMVNENIEHTHTHTPKCSPSSSWCKCLALLTGIHNYKTIILYIKIDNVGWLPFKMCHGKCEC